MISSCGSLHFTLCLFLTLCEVSALPLWVVFKFSCYMLWVFGRWRYLLLFSCFSLTISSCISFLFGVCFMCLKVLCSLLVLLRLFFCCDGVFICCWVLVVVRAFQMICATLVFSFFVSRASVSFVSWLFIVQLLIRSCVFGPLFHENKKRKISSDIEPPSTTKSHPGF